jgi:hypothetical protein
MPTKLFRDHLWRGNRTKYGFVSYLRTDGIQNFIKNMRAKYEDNQHCITRCPLSYSRTEGQADLPQTKGSILC